MLIKLKFKQNIMKAINLIVMVNGWFPQKDLFYLLKIIITNIMILII